MTKKHTQEEWDELVAKHPAGTPVTGTVSSRQVYGVWVTLDEIPDVPALLEIIHFKVLAADAHHKIEFPEDYPAEGTRIESRILGWCEKPIDVRLTQLDSLNWIHQ